MDTCKGDHLLVFDEDDEFDMICDRFNTKHIKLIIKMATWEGQYTAPLLVCIAAGCSPVTREEKNS